MDWLTLSPPQLENNISKRWKHHLSIISVSIYGWGVWAGLNWVLGSESHKTAIKVLARLYFFLEFGILFQDHLVFPYGCSTEIPIFFLAVSQLLEDIHLPFPHRPIKNLAAYFLSPVREFFPLIW